MKPSIQFIVALVAVVGAGVGAAFLFFNGGARRAVLAAAILILGTQIPQYFLLKGWRTRNDRFLAAIAAGFTLRVLVLVAGVVFYVVPGRTEPAPFLLSLGAFLLTVVFAESIIEHRRIRGESAPAKQSVGKSPRAPRAARRRAGKARREGNSSAIRPRSNAERSPGVR